MFSEALTQELPALAWDDERTDPSPIYEYAPPKCPANDLRETLNEMPAIGAE